VHVTPSIEKVQEKTGYGSGEQRCYGATSEQLPGNSSITLIVPVVGLKFFRTGGSTTVENFRERHCE